MKNFLADLLSCQWSPSHQATDVECPSNGGMIRNIRVERGDMGVWDKDLLLQRWKEAAEEDDEYKSLLDYKRSGKLPKDSPLGYPVRSYAGAWKDMKLMDSDNPTLLIYDSSRIVPPTSLRGKLITESHKAHKLVDGLTQLRCYYYWPLMQSQ